MTAHAVARYKERVDDSLSDFETRHVIRQLGYTGTLIYSEEGLLVVEKDNVMAILVRQTYPSEVTERLSKSVDVFVVLTVIKSSRYGQYFKKMRGRHAL